MALVKVDKLPEEYHLRTMISRMYGKIESRSSSGYGEGCVVLSVQKDGTTVEGISSGDCSSQEALVNLGIKLGIIEIKVMDDKTAKITQLTNEKLALLESLEESSRHIDILQNNIETLDKELDKLRNNSNEAY